MDFQLTEEQTMFRDMAKDFAIREVLPTVQERDRAEKFFPDIMERMGDQGLLSIMVPQDYGGLGLGWLTLGVVAETIAAYDYSVGINFLIATTLQALPIVKFGTDEQKEKFIPGIIDGKKMGALGAVEPNAGSDAVSIETSAVENGDHWILNGNKTWITNANVGHFAIVLAQTDKKMGTKGITTFIVEKGMSGFSSVKIGHKLGIRSTDTGQLFFRDCQVPKSNVLGTIGKGMSVALSSIENTRYGLACLAVGVIQACIDASVKYCQERKQFGRPIGSYQLVQEKIADMVVDCEASRYLAYHVGYLKDKGLPHSRETAIAKLHNSEKAAKATRTAVELHGAYGFTDDFPVERLYRDCLGSVIFGGTSNIQRMLIARSELGLDAIAR
ncbi:MAG: acyl-CoA dehydrogenase family protein [Smithellaceae bacterium]